MAILTATEVTVLSTITATAGSITNNMIGIVQSRLTMMLNNYFLTDLDIVDTMTFNFTARTIISGANSFDEKNFLAADDIFIYNSYRNDGYQTLLTVSGKTLTLATGATVTDELSARSIIISVVKWPIDIKSVAAKMVAYDYDVRDKVKSQLKSYSLGPLSETYTDAEKDEYGYPKRITNPALDQYYIGRCF